MNPNDLLRQITISSPCPAKWESMTGDDRIRTCAECGKEVHNFEALTAEEAASLVVSRDGRLCGRFKLSRDGSVATRPEGADSPGVARRLRFRLRSLMALIAGIAAALGLAKYLFTSEPEPMIMGKIHCVIPPPAPASPCPPNGGP